MKTLRVISALFVVTITAAALHAQLIQINYTGAFAYTRGGPYDEPVSDPIPFHATAIFDSATPGARYGPYMVFDTSTWSFDHPNQPNFLRWQFLTYDLVFPSTSIYLRDSGRFDVVYDGHIPFINLQLYLSHGSESTHLPLPPFSLVTDGASQGLVQGGYIEIGNFFTGPITSVTAMLIPVPETETYGIAAVGLLTLMAIRTRQFSRSPA